MKYKKPIAFQWYGRDFDFNKKKDKIKFFGFILFDKLPFIFLVFTVLSSLFDSQNAWRVLLGLSLVLVISCVELISTYKRRKNYYEHYYQKRK